MKIIRHTIVLLSLIASSDSFAQKVRSSEHFLKLQPLSISERHFGWGLGAGYEFTAGKEIKYGLSFPLNYYHGISAQIGRPTPNFPDVKSRYATFSPTFNLLPIYNDRVSYGIGIGAQIMYAYGTRAVLERGISTFDEYIPEDYRAFRWSGFVNNQFAVRMGKGNNRFTIDLGIGTPIYNSIPDNNTRLMVKYNVGFAFAL